jgi:ABC-2 type transport system permease protein
MWITVSLLGDPDHGVILASYLGSFLMAGAFLAIGSCMSALTRNQVIAFVVAAAVCFIFVTSGMELVLDFFRVWMPAFIVSAVSSMSFLTHFDQIAKGVIDLADLVFYLSLIAFWLFATWIVVEQRKAA